MNDEILSGVLLDDDCFLSMAELSRACSAHAEWVVSLVEEGILEPDGSDIRHWQFSAPALRRARTTRHLQQDLGVNLAGAALVLDLLDEIEDLRRRLARLES
ncbi:chaperone modulator CbpM [Thiolapillus sp.]